MKRYLRFFLAAICVTVAILSLTSCFTTEYEYTEWEISDDGLLLSDGEYAYDAVEMPGWEVSENHCFVYMATADGEDVYGFVSRPLDSKKIIAVQLHDENTGEYLGTRIYATGNGIYELQYVTDNNRYLVDKKNEMSTPASSYFSGDGSSFENVLAKATLSGRVINSAEQVELVSYGLDGFLAKTHGTFVYYNDSVYYLPYFIGNIENSESYTVYELSNDARSNLKNNRNSMTEFTYETEYESPIITEEEGSIMPPTAAKASLLVIVGVAGIFAPAIPLAFALRSAIRKKWAIDFGDTTLLASSAVWAIAGLVIFILLL